MTGLPVTDKKSYYRDGSDVSYDFFLAFTILPLCSGPFLRHPGYAVNPYFAVTIFEIAVTIFKLPQQFLNCLTTFITENLLRLENRAVTIFLNNKY